jgi:hypothetical protein
MHDIIDQKSNWVENSSNITKTLKDFGKAHVIIEG